MPLGEQAGRSRQIRLFERAKDVSGHTRTVRRSTVGPTWVIAAPETDLVALPGSSKLKSQRRGVEQLGSSLGS
jgi:hypothetical protein